MGGYAMCRSRWPVRFGWLNNDLSKTCLHPPFNFSPDRKRHNHAHG
ncbi:hypothetical protein ENSA5_16880 [Enhygromyxa salina]|uniref:Uncharacterized protein n=1 Tax=Enhygromyxa salina TaxID=215803 RepID=A0A2S9YDZ1_9BACT|nr:hypothetical protein ENSA5_16880 [Enhygromyxa salina]